MHIAELSGGRRLIFVCGSGGRAALATRLAQNFTYDAVCLEGGMKKWRAAGGAVVTGQTGQMPRQPADAPSARAVQVLADSTVCDMTFGFIGSLAPEIARFETSGHRYVSITAGWDSESSPPFTLDRLAKHRYFFNSHPDRFILVDRVADIVRAREEGKLAIGFHFQGSEAVNRDLSLVESYYRLGVRWMLLAYNHQNSSATGCLEAEERDHGLSWFGRKLVAEMNRVGMFVDLSHTGYRSTMDALSVSSDPCIFSHSLARALYDHPRNIRDEQIRAVAKGGGLIGVNGVGTFLGVEGPVTAAQVFRHVEHLVNLVGPRHVALGLDYMSPETCEAVYPMALADPQFVAMAKPPWYFLEPTQLVDLVECMVRAGYADADIKLILGGNFLRLAEQIWK